MAWAKLDDGFHDHPKLIGLGLDAVGLYTLALTWAHRHLGASRGCPGHIPRSLPARFAGAEGDDLAGQLERAGLWDVEPDLGGWTIHDFTDYLPAADKPATSDQVRAARSEAGRRGAKARWQSDGKLPSDEWQTDGTTASEPDGNSMPPNPNPNPNHDDPPDGGSSARADVERICSHLAGRIADNGSRRPTVTRRWRTSARLLLDVDHHSADQVVAAIDWCQADPFWRSVVLSMPKLREKYDQLRLAAARDRPAARPSTTDARVEAGLALAAKYAAAEAGHTPAIGA